MENDDIRASERSEECTTTESFADHGIDDGSDLITRTYYRLEAGDVDGFTPTESFYDRLESAFIWAYLGSVGETAVPDDVLAAVDDAKVQTAVAFEDRPDADLRTDVVPAFYRRVADFHCAYRE